MLKISNAECYYNNIFSVSKKLEHNFILNSLLVWFDLFFWGGGECIDKSEDYQIYDK